MKSFLPRSILAAAMIFGAAAVIAADLDTDAKKQSYTFGVDIGRMLKNQGADIDMSVLLEAIETGYQGQESQLSDEEMREVRENFMAQQRAAAQAKINAEKSQNQAEGTEFLAKNRSKAGVRVTDSGLQYRVIAEGSGERPGSGDSVTVHYRGKLLDGSEFDSSYKRNEPTSFALNAVIPGWTEGLQLMTVGSKYEFYIPYELAYGEQGRPPVIPPAALLIFEVELLDIN